MQRTGTRLLVIGLVGVVATTALACGGGEDDAVTEARNYLDGTVVEPTEGEAPLEVQAETTLVEGVGLDDVTVTWDFDDGATADGLTATHTYEYGGEYTVTVTATDADGNDEVNFATVKVTGPAPPDTDTPDVDEQVTTTVAGSDATDDTGGDGQATLGMWADEANGICESSAAQAAEAAATATGPDDPDYLAATATITAAETTAFAALPLPGERTGDVERFLEARDEMADLYLSLVADGEYSADDRQAMIDKILEVDFVALANDLGASSCSPQ